MKIENIIERMLDHEFFDQDYQNAIAQHLKPTVLIPELKPLLKTTVSFDADSKFELPTKLPLPPSVSKHPICAYLYSVDQHEYPVIQRWAVHNLHAACILKAIPNPTEKDHQTTIIRVFNRFRLANEAYAASQQGKQLNRYQQEYLWLWEQLPSHEITLADFVKSLRELENDSKLNRFQYLLLLDIRRFYDYVLALKPKKHYSAPPKHIDEPIYLDEHNAYLYSVDQHEYPVIQRWAVHNLHAACILKAIPNPTEKDHQTTIIRVFNRFRLANEAYAASQQGKQLNRYQQEYLWLWEQLPSHEITLADFVKSLRELENDSKLNRFQYLLLLDIRRFYDYVLALKPKKHYSAPPKHIDEPIYLDEHNVILHCPYDMPQKQHPALFYEELQDEQPNQQYSLNTAQVSPLASQSSYLQHQVSKLTQQHIIRQQHNFSCSKHYPDFNSLSLLVKHCHQVYLNHPEKNKAYLFILLSFLSGVPIEQWLELQTNQRRVLNNRQKLILENDQYFLRSKFTLFENTDFKFKEQLLNQVTYFDLPLIKELVDVNRTGFVRDFFI